MKVKALLQLITSLGVTSSLIPLLYSTQNVSITKNKTHQTLNKTSSTHSAAPLPVWNWRIDANGLISPNPDSAWPSDVTIPSDVGGKKVTGIAANAFKKTDQTPWRNIQSFEIEDGIKTIGSEAFSGLENLRGVTFSSDLTQIGFKAFAGCGSLDHIDLPTQADLTIMAKAFYGCPIRSVSIPSNVVNIVSEAFGDNSALNSLSVSPDNTKYLLISSDHGAYIRNKDFTREHELIGAGSLAYGDLIFEDSEYLESIKGFRSASAITSITLTNHIEIIKQSAFAFCTNLSHINFNGATKLGTIEAQAFQDCTALNDLSFPDENPNNIPIDLYPNAFQDCTELRSIYFSARINNVNDPFVTTKKINSKSVKVGLPHLQSLKVSADNSEYKTVDFLRDNDVVGSCVIYKNTSLDQDGRVVSYLAWGEVNFQDEYSSNYTTLGANRFQRCSSLSKVDLTHCNINTIGASAFEDCTNITELHLGQQISKINPAVFRNCESVSNVYAEWGSNIEGVDFRSEAFTNLAHNAKIHANFTTDISQIELYQTILDGYRNQFTNASSGTEQYEYDSWWTNTSSLVTDKTAFFKKTVHTILDKGFAAWVNVDPLNRRLELADYTISDTIIDNNVTVDPVFIPQGVINEQNNMITTNLVPTHPNINPTRTIITPRLKFINGSTTVGTVNLSPITINLEANNNLETSTPELTINSKYPNSRNGLWVGGDSYKVVIDINKAYFGARWNEPSFIQTNFNEFIDAYFNESELTLIHTQGSNVYFNERFGNLTVERINTDLNSPNSYKIVLTVSVPTDKTSPVDLNDGSITFNLKQTSSGQSEKINLFSVNTYDGYDFDPQIRDLETVTSVINLDQTKPDEDVIWNAKVSREYGYIMKNSFEYWKAKGYDIKLFSPKTIGSYFTISNDVSYDSNTNNLTSHITWNKLPEYRSSTIKVKNIQMVVSKNGQEELRFPMPEFTVNLPPISTQVIWDKTSYSNPEKSLKNINDSVTIDVKVPLNIAVKKLSEWINEQYLQIKYTNAKDPAPWSWVQKNSLNGEDDGYLVYDTASGLDPYELSIEFIEQKEQFVTYEFVLTQKFEAKTKHDIDFNIVDSANGGININADEYTPPTPPTPLSQNMIILIASVSGAAVIIGLVILGIYIVRRKNRDLRMFK